MCLSHGTDSLEITREDGDAAKGDTLKIFVKCNPRGMPRPFHLKKEGKTWKFFKI